ncbi:MAG: hypothetical protein U0736_22695 [Gemmataceae bacterium]
MTPVLHRLQQSLPKPLLFALYGAVGGLLGAVVLGELLWALLRPPAARAAVAPPLRLAVSPSVAVYQKGRNQFAVRLHRTDYPAAVTVRADGLPAGVTVEPVTLAADQTEGDAGGRLLLVRPCRDDARHRHRDRDGRRRTDGHGNGRADRPAFVPPPPARAGGVAADGGWNRTARTGCRCGSPAIASPARSAWPLSDCPPV